VRQESQVSAVAKLTIAVASGKGGTGKTTLAVALALSAPPPVRLLDCDVEEPNCHIFIGPAIQKRETVSISVPSVDGEKCSSCGECGRICQYSAIISLKTKPLVFPELCHGCGGCAKVCPRDAITEVGREIGVVEVGARDGVQFVQGRLNVGHPMSPPLIRAVKKHLSPEGLNVIDCPPGTSCPVVASVKGSDFVVLVTEPTPFGLHDLKIAVETVRQLGIPFGVVINRADAGDDRVRDYCKREGISVLLELPEDRRVAEAYSRGESILSACPHLQDAFARLHGQIEQRALTAPRRGGATRVGACSNPRRKKRREGDCRHQRQGRHG
jgi:MinD superfamily P-loop ATPase